MDEAARQLGVDRFELRRRNLIRPEQLPYKTISHLEYDCGDFVANFERALELSDRSGFAERAAESARNGKLRGFGLCNTVEALGFGLDEEADIRCAADGTIELRIGSMSNGQGHDTIYAQIVAGKLGLPVDDDATRLATIRRALLAGTAPCFLKSEGHPVYLEACVGQLEKALTELK